MFDSALVLTPWYQPHAIATWHESVTAVLTKKANVLEEYDSVIRSPSLTLRTPAVVVLRKHLSRMKNDVKFSRRNVYARDGHECQFCGREFAARELTYDHVLPRCRGGRTTWENIVTSCKKCNGRKGNRTPQEASMRLLSQPVKPRSLPLSATVFVLPKHVPVLWLPYLEGHRTMPLAG